MSSKNKVILVILDGFGASPVEEGNAVLKAKMPNFDKLLANYPKTLLHASANEVGLEMGEVGNSEVGHINLGSGRVIAQNLSRISQSIKNKTFFANKSLINACEFVKKNKSTLHLMGLISNGGVHSHIDHLLALLDLVKQQNIDKVSIHFITDGRDTAAHSAQKFIKIVDDKLKKLKIGKISTICGRFYAMDRDKNWDRTQLAYELFVNGKGEKYDNADLAIEAAYKRKEDDENIKPSFLVDGKTISDKDAVVFFNFRQDRSYQLAISLVEEKFNHFNCGKRPNIFFSCFVSYGEEPNLMSQVAFFQPEIDGQLSSIISKNNLSQIHAAETEKYAHVTYFFNGGQEKEFKGESRILVPSPKVTSYDQKPQMSLNEVVDKFINQYKKQGPAFSVLNFANPDMVGHTGNFKAAIRACEVADLNIGKIVDLTNSSEANLIITADHGNCEQMISPYDKSIDKNHTTNPVPFVIAGHDLKINDSNKFSYEEKLGFFAAQPIGVIADVSPTIIDLLELKKPGQMTTQSLRKVI